MPEAVSEVFAALAARFHPERATGVDAVFQFEATGDDGGTWHLVVHDGTCALGRGDVASPTVTLRASGETWLRIASGAVDPQRALLMGRLKLSGDMALALRLRTLFDLGR